MIRAMRMALVLALLTGLAAPAAAHPGRAIVVDGRGRVWFVDTSRDILWRVDGPGVLVSVASGRHSDRLVLVGDSAVTAEDYFATTLGPRLERLAADSSFPRRGDAVRLAGTPLAFATLDREGNAYFLLNGSLLMLTPDDSLRERTHGLPAGSAVSTSVAPDGSVYIVAGNRIWDVPPGRGVRAATDPGAFEFVSAVAARSGGGTCIVDYGKRSIHVYGDERGTVREVNWPWYPVGTAGAPDGACYVLERRLGYGGAVHALLGWTTKVLGGPRVRLVDASGNATLVVAVGGAGIVWPLATFLVAAGALGGIWALARRLRRAA